MTNTHVSSTEPQAATPEQTRLDLLGGQHRLGPPIRRTFLQELGGARRPGPLHNFVNDRRYFALQLYLLLHSLPLKAPWDAYLPAAVWARALDKTKPGAEATVSRNWQYLRDLQLIRTRRDRRLTRAYLLNENGSGAEYKRSKQYFRLPLAYFLNDWYDKLSLPGTVALLIALDRSRTKEWFELPKERAAGWFGISADTLQRGLDELRVNGLIEVKQRPVTNARARFGWTPMNYYRLLDDFSRSGIERPSSDEDSE